MTYPEGFEVRSVQNIYAVSILNLYQSILNDKLTVRFANTPISFIFNKEKGFIVNDVTLLGSTYNLKDSITFHTRLNTGQYGEIVNYKGLLKSIIKINNNRLPESIIKELKEFIEYDFTDLKRNW